MGNHAQPPDKSILVTRPTNEFYGLFAAYKQRHVYLFVVSLMTVFSEFLPILLSNVPFSLTQVEISSIICARLTLGILLLMVLTLVASFFIKWPHLPVDPRTIAGAMYYITDSYMLHSFEGMGMLERKDRDGRIRQLGRRYYYGEIVGRSGRRRKAIDADVSLTEADTAYRGHGGLYEETAVRETGFQPHPSGQGQHESLVYRGPPQAAHEEPHEYRGVHGVQVNHGYAQPPDAMSFRQRMEGGQAQQGTAGAFY